MSATLLLEIGVEELPPTALRSLMNAFADGIVAGLDEANLTHGPVQPYATPRRFAVSIAGVGDSTPAQSIEKAGPTVAIAFDDDGNPTPAAEGFARSVGTTVAMLEKVDSDKGQRLIYRGDKPGISLSELLPEVLDNALRQLPIPKRMRWGDSDVSFVRPVHWLVAMHGAEVLPLEAFGIQAGNQTRGHRFHFADAIVLDSADEYADRLRSPGFVLADYEQRKNLIHKQLIACADEIGGTVQIAPDLLDEVSALVEWPAALSGRFDERYLMLPCEVLISTLQGHQRYFPVTQGNDLLNAFITVANIESTDPEQVVSGNERVIRPRLSDALFFWEQDRAKGLAQFADGLDRVNFQRDLGSMADKTARIQTIAAWLAQDADEQDSANLDQAAALAKADLLTDMVNEFPELQGIMGHYYALDAQYHSNVAEAIGEQYAPASAGADIPKSKLGRLLAIADRLDTLAGIFALGKRPTGDKDPFALRRAALGVLRIIIEGQLTIDLRGAIEKALTVQPANAPLDTVDELLEFHFDRLRGYYAEQGFTPEQFEAIVTTHITDLRDFDQRIHAVAGFIKLPAAVVVCGAHKRARNLLKKNAGASGMTIDPGLLKEEEELTLADALSEQLRAFDHALSKQAYADALASLAALAEPLDAFFEHVMVMTDDEALRNNRLALLATLDNRCRQVADISRLSASTN